MDVKQWESFLRGTMYAENKEGREQATDKSQALFSRLTFSLWQDKKCFFLNNQKIKE